MSTVRPSNYAFELSGIDKLLLVRRLPASAQRGR